MRNDLPGCLNWQALGAISFLLATVLVVFVPIITGQGVFWFFDVSLFHYPNHTVLSEAVSTRDLSSIIWNANIGTGFPLWAEGQIGPLYPINWIVAALFDPLTAYSAGQIVHYFLAAIFTYAYARALDMKYPAAVVTALAFTFSGHLVGAMSANTILRSAVWLPLMFWGIERFIKRRRFFYLGASGVGLAMQVLGGYPATAALGGLSVSLYGLFRILFPPSDDDLPSFRNLGTRILYALVIAGLVGTLGFSLAAGHLLPQMELSQFSSRVNASYEYLTMWSLPPFHLITLIWPLVFHNPVERVVWGVENLGRTAIYVGILPLALTTLAIFERRKRPGWTTFFIALALVAFALALGRYNPFYRWVSLLPPFNRFRAPSGFGYLFVFSLALLAGRGLDLLLSKDQPSYNRRLTALAATLLTLTLPIFAWQLFVQRIAANGQLAQVLEPWQALMKANRDPALLIRSVQMSAHPLQATAFMPLVMLVATASWLVLRRTRLRLHLWAWVGIGIAAVDLVFFATTIRNTQIAPRSVATAEFWTVDVLNEQTNTGRAAVSWSLYPMYTSHQPNRLMTERIPTLQAYTPLATKRMSDYLGLARQNRADMARFLQLASVQYALDTESQTYAGVSFISQKPLAVAGLWRNPQVEVDLPTPMPASRIQLIFAQTGWPTSEPDECVEVTLTDSAGQRETWSLCPTNQSSAAETATFQQIDRPVLRDPLSWRGEDFSVEEWPLYYAEIHASADSLTQLTIIPPADKTLYLMGLVVESATDERWVAGEQPFHQVGFSLFYDHPHGAIYAVDDPLPQAYVVHQVRTVDSTQALATLLDPQFDPQTEAVVTEGPETPMNPADSSNEHVEITAYLPTRVDVALDLSAAGLLVLTDSDYPGWYALIDGVRRPIVSANYLFRGIYVEEGQHDVSFIYSPASLKIGLAITLTSALGILVGTVIEWLRKRK